MVLDYDKTTIVVRDTFSNLKSVNEASRRSLREEEAYTEADDPTLEDRQSQKLNGGYNEKMKSTHCDGAKTGELVHSAHGMVCNSGKCELLQREKWIFPAGQYKLTYMPVSFLMTIKPPKWGERCRKVF